MAVGINEGEVVGEPRWHMAGAVAAALVLVILLPDGERIGPPWLLPLLATLLLVALFAGDPGAIDRRSNVLRVISIALVSVLVLNSLWATAQLIDALDQRWKGDQLGRRSARRGDDRLDLQLPRLRAAVLGARQRRSARRAPITCPTIPTSPFRSR